MQVGRQRRRRAPFQVDGIVDAALDGGKSPPVPRPLDAGAHGVEADKLHDLGGKLFGLRTAVANAHLEHEVAQAHDAQTDPPGAERGLFDLGHRGNVLVGIHHVVQEAEG